MKLLAISHAYPPLAYPRSIQVARLLKHTNASTVLFCADEPDMRRDETIEPEAEALLTACIRVPAAKSDWAKFIDKIAYRVARGLWNRRNLVPDAYGGWKDEVISKAVKYTQDNNFRPDVIVTFAQPFSGHLIGLELKSRLNLPWLAHFSDPWADNPFHPFDANTKALNLNLERSVAEAADMLVFTSKETVELFFAKYPAELKKKARVLPQCFDAKQFANKDGPRAEKITIRYLGNFYGGRTPRPLIEALRSIRRTRSGVLDDVAIELVGPGDETEVRKLASDLPSGLLSVRPSVNYIESLSLMSSADGLLIIDAPAEVSVFLPSKLIDYIGAGRPIFGITPKGAAASLISELGGSVANPAEIDKISAGLVHFVTELRNRRAITPLDEWGTPEVRRRYTAGRIASAFETMLAELKNRP